MYKGKEICQCCGKSGAEVPRYGKDELCQDCKEIVKLGKAVTKESLMEYVNVRDWVNGLSSFDFEGTTLDDLANEVMSRLNNPTAPTKGEVVLRPNFGHGTIFYRVPKDFAEPVIEFIKKVNDVVYNIRKEKEALPDMARQAVKDEKNRIYNEGLEAGRDLLNQLNRGEVTMDDFNKTVIKY